MTEMVASLVLTGDARGLIAASQRGEAALETVDGTLKKVKLSTKSASDSAQVFSRALDDQAREANQLRQSLDPVFASQTRLEAGQQTLTRAVRSGSISAREYTTTLRLLEQQHRQVQQAANLQTSATSRLTTVTRGGAGGMQNFSYQLQDIFTQVGMGVPLMVSLGQQAPQILSGFGTVGAMAGVAAAAILPLSAAVFGLGYQSKTAAENVKTASDEMGEAFEAIGNAQSTLRENSVSDLDTITAKYGEVTASVLTLMQAQNDLALQTATTQTREGIGATFGDPGFQALQEFSTARDAVIAELNREINALEIQLPIRPNDRLLRDELDALRVALQAEIEGEALELDLGIDVDQMQDILIFRNAIEASLKAENYSGLLTVIEQMRTTLQQIPDGPLRGMLEGIVASEGALREALNTAEVTADTHAEIEGLLSSIGSVDVAGNIAAGADQAARMANELGRAVSAAIQLANQGVGSADRARINYEFRGDPEARAAALANAEFNSRTQVPAGADSTVTNVIEGERREFVRARVEAARYTRQLQDWNAEQRKAGRSAGRSGGGGRGGGAGRDAGAAQDRAIAAIGRELDRLAPSYDRDIARLETWYSEAMATLDPARQGYAEFAADVAQLYDLKLADAYKRDLERREDWAAGVERAFMGINDTMLSWADVSEGIATDWSGGLEDAFVSLATTGKASVDDLVDHTLEQLLRMSYQMALQPAFETLFGFASSAIGGLFGGGGLGGIFTQSHAGSEIGSGGVRRSYGAGAPLRADERLTVTKIGQRVFTPEQIANGSTVVNALAAAAARPDGGGGVVFAPTIQVVNQSSAPVTGEVEERDDGTGGRNYRLVIADQVGAAITQKGGGATRALRNTYGMNKVGTRR